MRKLAQDGLILDQAFLMIDERKPGVPIPARAIQFLAILIAGWSTFSVLLEALSAPVNYYAINGAILLCAGVMFALCVIPFFDLVKLFFCLLFYGLFLYSRMPQLKNGFYLFENLTIERLYTCYNYMGYYFVADSSTRTEDTTLLTIMIMIPVFALLSIAVVRNRLINLCSLILFLPVTASFLLGVIPSEKYMIGYIAAILYLTKSGIPFRHIRNREQRTLIHRISSRAAVWMSLLGLLVFCILRLFISQEKYDNIAQLNDMKTKVQQTFMETSIEDISDKLTSYKLFEIDTASGGMLGGELGKSGKVEYTGEKQLTLTVPYSAIAEGIYLKGYVGSDYTKSRWMGHSREDRKKYNELMERLGEESFSPVNQTTMLLDLFMKSPVVKEGTLIIQDLNVFTPVFSVVSPANITKATMKVDYENANKRYLYAPYFTNFELMDGVYDQADLYAAPSDRDDNYSLDYYYNVEEGDLSFDLLERIKGTDYETYEKLYRYFVYDVYTQLPSKGIDRLKEDFSVNKKEIRNLDLKGRLDYVKNYLDQNTEYSLAPGKLPKGKDFVEYFLYENKKGYCSHYASSATLMLRAMGVPARYAEGYAIGASRTSVKDAGSTQEITTISGLGEEKKSVFEVTIDVLDSNAHAWVEVYMDGVGWVPVEFTPGAAIQYNTTFLGDMAEDEEAIDDNDVELQPTLTPQPTMAPMNMDQQRPTKDQKTPEQKLEEAKEKEKLDRTFIILFFLLAAVTLILPITLFMLRRSSLKKGKNLNWKAIVYFIEMEKILNVGRVLPGKRTRLEDCEEYMKEYGSFIDSDEFIACMEIVKKARFGKGSISAKELRLVEEFREMLYRHVTEELSPIKKFELKLRLFCT